MTDAYARYTRLKFDRPHPKVLRITMENGQMNTTDAALHAELADIWRDVDKDASVNAAILTGAGKVFSAGGDFAIIQENIDDFAARARQWKEARDIVYNVINCSKPVVSAMRGVAVGAGLVCGLLADVSIATKDCRIIDGHTRLDSDSFLKEPGKASFWGEKLLRTWRQAPGGANSQSFILQLLWDNNEDSWHTPLEDSLRDKLVIV